MFASGSRDGTVILWDLLTNSMRARFPGQGSKIGLAFSPDGATLATVGLDIRLWDTATGRGLATLPRYSMPFAFASSTEIVAVNCSYEWVRLDLESGDVLARFPFSNGDPPPDDSAISPDGSIALSVVSHEAPELQVWDLTTGELRSTLAGWSDTQHLAISPQNSLLVVGGWSSLRLCDLHTGESRTLSLCAGEGIECMAISGSGRLLALGTNTGAVKLWAFPSGREVRFLPADRWWTTAVAFSSDGDRVASASRDSPITIWDVAGGECLQQLPGQAHEVLCVSFSPEGRTFAGGHSDGTVRWWDASTGRLLRTLYCSGRRVTSLAFSADGQTLACSSVDPFESERLGVVEVWGLGTGARLQEWEIGTGTINSVLFLAQGRLLAVSGRWDTGEETLVWNRDGGELCYRVKGGLAAISPDGTLLATSLDEVGICLWDTASGALVRTLGGIGGEVLRFSPDGTTLLVGYHSPGMALWSVATGERLWDADTPADVINALVFSPDGQTVAVGGAWENELWLRRLQPQVAQRAAVQTLSGHENNVEDISFHPSGRRLVSAGADGSLKMWDAAESRLLATFRVLPTTNGTVSEEWITFTPTGHYVGSAEVDRFVNWQVDEKLLPAEAFRAEFHCPDLVAEALQSV